MKKVVTIILLILLIPMVYYLIVGINNFNTVEELYNIINIDEYRDRQTVNIRYIYLLLIIKKEISILIVNIIALVLIITLFRNNYRLILSLSFIVIFDLICFIRYIFLIARKKDINKKSNEKVLQ